MHTSLNGDRLTVGKGLTVCVDVAVFEQPFPSVNVYVIVCVPAPAEAGSNELPVTPVPLYVPPVGEPADRINAGRSMQTSARGIIVTVGNAFTVM